MKLKAMILTLVALLLTLTVTAAESEQVTDEAMCTTPDMEPTIGLLSVITDYMFISHNIGDDAFQYDFATDGLIDREDYDHCVACIYNPLMCDFAPLWPITTVCDPVVIWSTDTTAQRGSASVTYAAGTATVTGVGSSGDDGVRIWPNMDENWRDGLRIGLENVELGGSLSEGASFAFTGVEQGYTMEWLARVEAGHDGGQISLSLAFEQPAHSTIYFRASVGDTKTESSAIAGAGLSLSGDPINGTPAITAVTFLYTNQTILAVELDRAVEFTIDGELPAVTFVADHLLISAENSLQPPQGLGPFDVQGTDLGSFTVTLEEYQWLWLPCLGRVGDANGVGGDEPTIGDISAMIDAKFLMGECWGIIASMDEADVNQSGPPNAATCDDVTISDISILIDYLFLGGPENVTLNECF